MPSPDSVTPRGFDAHALDYVERWDKDRVGAAFRRRVHEQLRGLISPGQRVLDLGCGPGVDSAFMARCGAHVHAVDASPGMRAQARSRCTGLDVHVGPADLRQPEALPSGPFDGLLLDFGVINCAPMAPVAEGLASRLAPGGWLVVVPMTRPAIAHWLSVALSGHPREAWRRATARTVDVEGSAIPVHFPTARAVRRTFAAAGLVLMHQEALGALLPAPGPATKRLHGLVAPLESWDRRLGRTRVLRSLGDHTLLVFRPG